MFYEAYSISLLAVSAFTLTRFNIDNGFSSVTTKTLDLKINLWLAKMLSSIRVVIYDCNVYPEMVKNDLITLCDQFLI